ncbi:MAG TPA: ABC transporter ATP-binding protein [Clostridiales bacterium]|nr:ABC transporter ATP-binding protein [Clostridiales bacterium]
MLTVQGLTKHYGKKAALRDVSFTLEKGVYGLLGPNGAGKSTLMGLLTLNLRPTGGEIFWNHIPVAQNQRSYRKQLGYMPQQQALYPGLTAWEYLDYMAALKGMKKRAAEAEMKRSLEQVGLSSFRNQKIRTFSGGMKQRLLLAQAVLNKPALLILDEPTAGLDPRQRIGIRNLISELAQESTILIATHVVPDVDLISREILLLKEGELIRKASRQALCRELQGRVREMTIPASGAFALMKESIVSALRQETEGEWIARIVMKAGETPIGTEVTPTLEDVYLSFFGESKDVETDLL